MKNEEYGQKQVTAGALAAGGVIVLAVLLVALLFSGCAVAGIGAPPGRAQFVGQVELVTESDGVCLLRIIALPSPTSVRRLHLGTWQEYVANVPRGWPLPYEVTRWPMMIPNSCDEIGLCQWLDAREGRDCAEFLKLGAVRVEVGAQ